MYPRQCKGGGHCVTTEWTKCWARGLDSNPSTSPMPVTWVRQPSLSKSLTAKSKDWAKGQQWALEVEKFYAVMHFLMTSCFTQTSFPIINPRGRHFPPTSLLPARAAQHALGSDRGPQTSLRPRLACSDFCQLRMVDSWVFCPHIWIWSRMAEPQPRICDRFPSWWPRTILEICRCGRCADGRCWMTDGLDICPFLGSRYSLSSMCASSILLPLKALGSTSVWEMCVGDYYYLNWEMILIGAELPFQIFSYYHALEQIKCIFNNWKIFSFLFHSLKNPDKSEKHIFIDSICSFTWISNDISAKKKKKRKHNNEKLIFLEFS